MTNHLFNVITNALIFSLLRSTDTKQRFSNFSCFWDHSATIDFAVITFLHCETSTKKLTDFFFNFVNISPIALLHSVKFGLR